ncbi:MAG: putative metal-binding motif-containing protein, partial [Vicinamibacterales bacterium]|nr:putative metal-binding motif-containing protein [Vicinamibacterales bacterium]
MANDDDCDDSAATTNPDATETCDGADNDCDGVVPADEADADGDGYAACAGDCDDGDPGTNPGATEVCDGIDNDCDGEIDENGDLEAWPDEDGDGYGDENAASIQACDLPSGYADNPRDCDDSEATTYEGATEQCDGIDNDCDGSLVDEFDDFDEDLEPDCI